jgi:hypothetical protein
MNPNWRPSRPGAQIATNTAATARAVDTTISDMSIVSRNAVSAGNYYREIAVAAVDGLLATHRKKSKRISAASSESAGA